MKKQSEYNKRWFENLTEEEKQRHIERKKENKKRWQEKQRAAKEIKMSDDERNLLETTIGYLKQYNRIEDDKLYRKQMIKLTEVVESMFQNL